MDWLFQSDFDGITTVALWSIAAVLATTVVLFAYTMGLRAATILGQRRRTKFVNVWRKVFANAMLSEDAAENCALPRVARSDRTDLLEEWNHARSIVEGSAADNLIILARRAGVPALALKRLRKRRVRPQILAAQTFGHLRDLEFRDDIRQLLDHENTALSITAAVALVEIDADFAIPILVPMIEKRRDWPKNRVSILLRMAGSERISEPLYRAIRSADDRNKTYLLQFAQLVEAEVLDALVNELIRDSNDPGVLNAALKLVSGFSGVPRIAALTQHDTWFVRMQSANVLGRIGQEEHLSLLESLLDDKEWWVRYRAAQAIAALPFLGPNQLRHLRDQQTDPYAADILQQSMAEVGLA
ncbi:MAG: HEAT repeat domain-containing protein [Woeseiaceae bacterium]